ncbi:MAG: hypothetical protein ACJ8CB_00295 [Ktedonobacteraceae bacterium]
MMGEWKATNEQIAEYCGVDKESVRFWRREHPEFDQAVRKAKLLADNRVAGCLYHMAVSGNVQAQIHWLNNRRPSEWRSKHDVDLRTPDGFQVEYPVLDVEKMLNLSPQQKAEFSRTCRAYQEAVNALALMPATVVEVESDKE